MTTIRGKGTPKGFSILPEGEHVLHITDVKAIPRANPTVVTMKMLNADGLGFDKYPQKYNLDTDGGYAAFFWLVKNGYDIDLNDGDEFDVDQLEDTYVRVRIEHDIKDRRDGNGTVTFANIKETIGPGEPFDGAAPATADAEDEDFD